MISSNVSAGFSPSHQFISFSEGSSSEPPDPNNYAVQVLQGDNLNVLDGGDPTNGFAPWVTDVLIYPSSEYWESLLQEGRLRPYFDLSISNYNTLRVPSSIHNYDLYVDSAKIYEDIEVDGNATITSQLTVGNITSDNFKIEATGDVEFQNIKGVANTRSKVITITEDTTLENSQSGAIINSKPTGANLNVTLPGVGEEGVTFSFMNCVGGATTSFEGVLARGSVLSEQYTACTIYWGGDAWYGFGDLV